MPDVSSLYLRPFAVREMIFERASSFELLVDQNESKEKTELSDIHKISDIIFAEKKELVKSVSEICDKTIQNIMKVR